MGGVGPDLWTPADGNGYLCNNSEFNTASFPTGLPGGACSGGTPTGCNFGAWQDVGKTIDLTKGSASVASNGTSYVPVSIVSEFAYNVDPFCNGCGSLLGHPVLVPAAPVGTASNCSGNMVSAGNDFQFNGASTTASDSDSPLLYYEAGSGHSSVPLKLDSFTCQSGPPVGDRVQVPSTYYTGGAADGGVYSPCGLISVTGLQKEGLTYSSGQGYSATFHYTGGADQIVVDPGDLGSATVKIGVSDTSGTEVDVPTDASIAQAYDGVTVSWSPSTTGAWDPQFWCVSGGVAYWWYDAYTALQQVPPNTVQICYNAGAGSTTTFAGATPGNLPGASFNLDQCFSAAGWSLTNPVSWVTGGLHDGLCILEWLFVPSLASLTGFVNLFSVSSSGASSATLGQWFGTLTSWTTSWPSTAVGEVQTAEQTGGCSVGGPTVSAGAQSFNVCSLVSTAGGVADWSPIKAVVGAGFVLMMGLALFHLLRRAVTGNTA